MLSPDIKSWLVHVLCRQPISHRTSVLERARGVSPFMLLQAEQMHIKTKTGACILQ